MKKHFIKSLSTVTIVVMILVTCIPVVASANEQIDETGVLQSPTFEDLIAGLATPEEVWGKDALLAGKNANSTSISQGTYYINNLRVGGYIKNNSSSATVSSGLISSLGNSILWEIIPVSGGYRIRSKASPTVYLSVPESTSSLTILLESSQTSRGIWSITTSEIGGCLIQNTYNGSYLYGGGSSLTLSQTCGTVGGTRYRICTWRIITETNMAGRELQSGFSIKKLNLHTHQLYNADIITEHRM